MVDTETFRQMALALPGVTEEPHFHKASFRVNKKTFATLDEVAKLAVVMLTPVDQDVFSSFDRSAVYPVPNKWGLKGSTYIALDNVGEDILNDALATAYNKVISKSKSK